MIPAIGRPTVVAALPTPFDDIEELDLQATEVLARRLVEAGCDALFVGGTTGESPSLSSQERVVLLETSANAAGPDHVMAHVGSACARDSERLAVRARAIGVVDIAAATPYFLPADTERQFDYFQRISQATGDGRLWLYIFPERTGNHVTPELWPRLLELPNVYGAKVSSPGIDPIKEVSAFTGGRLRIFSGGDPDLLDAFSHGASGLVSGNCAVLPEAYVALAGAVERDDVGEMRLRQEQIRLIAAAIGGGPGGIKAALRELGRPIGHPRMAISDEVSDELSMFIKEQGAPEPPGTVTSDSARLRSESTKVRSGNYGR
jgi:4-hydroxy-tetrahydrodipicolinate synthase